MFTPIVAVIILSFNPQQFGSFPMEGFSFRWYVKLAQNQTILGAFQNSSKEEERRKYARRVLEIYALAKWASWVITNSVLAGRCEGSLANKSKINRCNGSSRLGLNWRGGGGGVVSCCISIIAGLS